MKNDGPLWTWGTHTYLGDGSAGDKRIVATEMIRPQTGRIKMIGVTSDKKVSSFYVLYEDGELYILGDNSRKQLGDWTTDEDYLGSSKR